jgi:hypothetical protein
MMRMSIVSGLVGKQAISPDAIPFVFGCVEVPESSRPANPLAQ